MQTQKTQLQLLLENLSSENGYYALRYLRKNWDGDEDGGSWIDDSDQDLLIQCVTECIEREGDK